MYIPRETQPYAPPDGSWGELRRDWIAQQTDWIGQIGPAVQNRHAARYGRSLMGTDGLGAAPAQESGSGFIRELEGDDDVYGSGIFDEHGRRSTVHRMLGVFEDHPSLPGYIEREVQFAVSPEIADIANGADVVVVPGGGMTYAEFAGKMVPPERRGPPVPRPDYPESIPSPPQARLERPPPPWVIYNFLDPGTLAEQVARLAEVERALLPEADLTRLCPSHIAAQQIRAGQLQAAATTIQRAQQAMRLVAPRRVPFDHQPHRQPAPASVPDRRAQQPRAAAHAVGGYEGVGYGAAVPFAPPGSSVVPRVQIVDAPTWQQPVQAVTAQPGVGTNSPCGCPPPVQGRAYTPDVQVPVTRRFGWSDAASCRPFAADEPVAEPTSLGTYAVAGILVGGAAALIVGAMKKGGKKKGRRR